MDCIYSYAPGLRSSQPLVRVSRTPTVMGDECRGRGGWSLEANAARRSGQSSSRSVKDTSRGCRKVELGVSRKIFDIYLHCGSLAIGTPDETPLFNFPRTINDVVIMIIIGNQPKATWRAFGVGNITAICNPGAPAPQSHLDIKCRFGPHSGTLRVKYEWLHHPLLHLLIRGDRTSILASGPPSRTMDTRYAKVHYS